MRAGIIAAPQGDRTTRIIVSHGSPMIRLEDMRGERRVPLRLHTALVYHQHADVKSRPTFHGVSHDVSMSGLSLIVDYNIYTEDEVTVLIALPPREVDGDKKIVEATARMIYTVYTSRYMAWRVALAFLEFKRDGEMRLREAVEAAEQLMPA
jgi:hypothetical protein